MKFLLIFLLGIGVLAGAITLNIIASKLGLLSWHEFIKNAVQPDTRSAIWLFFLYPFGLGVIAYYLSKLLHI